MFYLVFIGLFAAPDLIGTTEPWRVPNAIPPIEVVVEEVWITQQPSCNDDGTKTSPARVKVKTDSQEYKDYLHRLKFPQETICIK